MPEFYELKPNKAAFVAYYFLKQLFFSFPIAAIIALVLSAALGPPSGLTLALAYALLQAWIYFARTVSYGKEKYVFLRDRIVRKSGGVFSSRETELVIRNITHVTMKLPYLERRLFGTGSINIQSAGSGGVEIRLSSISSPEKFYEYAERLMKANGFSLTRKSLVQREKPSSIGVFFEVFKSFFTFFIVFIYFFPQAILGIIYLFLLSRVYFALFAFFAAAFSLFLFGHFLLRFLDLKRRVYEIYSDMITYSEGFLSKNYAFIPMENLSDSEVTQTLVDKVFGLYDVKISCQGAGNEILFKNMRNGQELEANLDKLISDFKSLVAKPKAAASASAIGAAEKRQPSARRQASLNPEYLAEFRMQMFRTLAPMILSYVVAILLIIIAATAVSLYVNSTMILVIALGLSFFLFLVAIIPAVIGMMTVYSTRYFVKKESVEERFDFLSSQHKEFTNEKIMAVIFRESFVDKWFRTCSVHFWSIGSGESIKFSNIPKSSQLYGSILGKIGIRTDEPIYSLGSEFNIADKLKAELFQTVFFTVFCIGLLVAGIIVNFAFVIALLAILFLFVIYAVYQNAYYKRSKLDFYRDFVHFRKGIFFKEFYYAPNDNIKGITTVKYPLSAKGSVTFDVAGEQIIEKRTKYGKTKTTISNHFRINYVPDIANKDDFIDLMFYRKPTSAAMAANIAQHVSKSVQKPLLVSKQAVANTFLACIIIFAFISLALTASIFPIRSSFPAIVPAVFAAELLLFLLIILLPVIGVKVKSYSIEPYRLVAKSGIFYKTQKSTLLSKIDHINLIQGVLNKMFRNGTIAVNTTGSSKTEMFIEDIPDFNKFYELLKQRY